MRPACRDKSTFEILQLNWNLFMTYQVYGIEKLSKFFSMVGYAIFTKLCEKFVSLFLWITYPSSFDTMRHIAFSLIILPSIALVIRQLSSWLVSILFHTTDSQSFPTFEICLVSSVLPLPFHQTGLWVQLVTVDERGCIFWTPCWIHLYPEQENEGIINTFHN